MCHPSPATYNLVDILLVVIDKGRLYHKALLLQKIEGTLFGNHLGIANCLQLHLDDLHLAGRHDVPDGAHFEVILRRSEQLEGHISIGGVEQG